MTNENIIAQGLIDAGQALPSSGNNGNTQNLTTLANMLSKYKELQQSQGLGNFANIIEVSAGNSSTSQGEATNDVSLSTNTQA